MSINEKMENGTTGVQLDRNFLLKNGYAIVPSVLDDAEMNCLRQSVESLANLERDAGRNFSGGIRNLLALSEPIRKLAVGDEIAVLVRPILGPKAFAVRGILFDKTPGSNWKVPWHQDLTIAVRERRDIASYGPWTTKAGVPHVQPPITVLENMLSIRLHLDDCGPENGALKVLPATHRLGRLSSTEIERLRTAIESQPCLTAAGGVVLMRPLLLHASSAAISPAHRRVIHIDYATADLGSNLDWYERYPRSGEP